MQAPLTVGTSPSGTPTLTMTLSSVTPQLQNVLNNSGHPELKAFYQILSSAPAQLAVTFAPGVNADGSDLVSTSTTGGRLLSISAAFAAPSHIICLDDGRRVLIVRLCIMTLLHQLFSDE